MFSLLFLQASSPTKVWAIGDCAALVDRHTGRPYPPTAQHALRQGKVAAQNVLAAIRGRPEKSFSFRTIGQLAAIGQRVGVAEILGIHFSGFMAWWLWRTVYLSKLPGWDRKLRVALQWTLDILCSKDVTQYLTAHAPVMSREVEDDLQPRGLKNDNDFHPYLHESARFDVDLLPS